MTDSARYQEAKQWVDSLADKWRLQILSKRFRINKSTGVRTELPTRVRRFVEGCPWALVNYAIRYLLSKAPYEGVVYNGVPLDGKYIPTLTTWKRDDNDETVTPLSDRRNDGTYTLVQDLVEYDLADKYSVGTAVSCSETVLTEWHWDEGSIETLPSTSEQGVTYAIQSVNRNEDGTFNYAVVERRAKTTGGTWGVQRSNPVMQIEVALWDNVYGEPGAFSGVPSAGKSGNTEIVLDWSQNDDCTYKVRATKTTKFAVDSDLACRKDVLKHEHVTGKSGQTSPLGEAPEPGGGLVTRHDSKMQDDGTYENRVTTEQERLADNGPQGSSDRLSTTVVVSKRNAVSVPSVPAFGSVRATVTPGGRFDYSMETVTPKMVSSPGGESDKLHTSATSTVKNATSVPSVPEIGSVRSNPTSYGFDYTTETITPKTVTARGGESDKLHRSATVVTKNGSGDPSVPTIGSAHVSPTAYGVDSTVETVSPIPATGTGNEKDKLHTASVKVTKNGKLANVAVTGEIGSTRVTPTAYGFDSTEETVSPISATATGCERDAFHTSTIEVCKNASQVPVMLTGYGSVRATPTAYGFDYTKETVDVSAIGTNQTINIDTQYFKACFVVFGGINNIGQLSAFAATVGARISAWFSASGSDGKIPSLRCHVSVSMNRYGLLDGTISAQCEYNPTTSWDKEVCRSSWTKVHTSYSPVMGEGNTLAGTIVTVRKSNINTYVGFGTRLFSILLQGELSEGSGGTYNPYTGGWTVTVVEQLDPETTFMPASN